MFCTKITVLRPLPLSCRLRRTDLQRRLTDRPQSMWSSVRQSVRPPLRCTAPKRARSAVKRSAGRVIVTKNRGNPSYLIGFFPFSGTVSGNSPGFFSLLNLLESCQPRTSALVNIFIRLIVPDYIFTIEEVSQAAFRARAF